MYDILTTAAIVDELAVAVAGGRIQRVGLRDRNTLVLEIYAHRSRHWLVAALAGREPVCYLSAREVGIDASTVTPFSLLLRKYLRGGTLVAIDQPPLDRLLRLSISKATRSARHRDTFGAGEDIQEQEPDEDNGEEWEDEREFAFTSLHIELMGRRSNIILVDDSGTILDSIKRVTPAMSRVRPILPHTPYSLPPSGDRIDPRAISAAQVEKILNDCDPKQPVAAALVPAIAAMSPQIGREIVFRVFGNAATRCGDRTPASSREIAVAIQWLFGVLERAGWQPSIYEDAAGETAAYSAVPFESLDAQFARRAAGTMSEVVELFSTRDISAGRHAARRDRLAALVDQELARVAARLANLQQQEQDLADADRYRRWGEAIYTNLWSIQPGQQELHAGEEAIPLDPALEPKDQAQAYFARYRKSGRGAGQIEQAIGQTRHELAYLDQLSTLIGLAETFDEIEALRREWESAHSPAGDENEPKRSRKPPRRAVAPRPVVDRFGNRIYVGRTGPQNELVTFDLAGPDDYWLHARGVPGAHVIVRPATVNPDALESSLERAAELAAYFSGSRTNSSVEVDICKRRDVRKIRGAGPGMVTYRNERTVNVRPVGPRAE
jgi:predicted ribosome quality control (RQC) complex YloA/Tae2 family protein